VTPFVATPVARCDTLPRDGARIQSRRPRAVQAPNRERHIANRELGSIEKIDDSGNLQLRPDSGRKVAFNIRENPHLDYGYAVTSHSSQGQTADRVLVQIDTGAGRGKTRESAIGGCGGIARTLMTPKST
jgi:ATP-dependent exoDNAse (exonuclease V) alpha subunit